MRRMMQVLVLGAAAMGTTGCRHRTKVAVVPVPPPSTVALAPAPEPETPPQVASVPMTPAPLPEQPVQPKVKKPKKKIEAPPPAAAPPPAPAEVASAGPPPDASVIGSLTAGGDAAPAEKQKAADVIGAVEGRLKSLSGSTLEAKKKGLQQVRSFVQQAHEALNSGDTQGASTLATKAKVLLDDLLK